MLSDEQIAHLTEVQARHLEELMEYINVVGVGIGIAQVQNQLTDEPAIVVMVTIKLPLEELPPDEVLPRQVEDVRVDVQPTGAFTAFSA